MEKRGAARRSFYKRLPGFWLNLAFGIALFWKLKRGWKQVRTQSAKTKERRSEKARICHVALLLLLCSCCEKRAWKSDTWDGFSSRASSGVKLSLFSSGDHCETGRKLKFRVDILNISSESILLYSPAGKLKFMVYREDENTSGESRPKLIQRRPPPTIYGWPMNLERKNFFEVAPGKKITIDKSNNDAALTVSFDKPGVFLVYCFLGIGFPAEAKGQLPPSAWTGGAISGYRRIVVK